LILKYAKEAREKTHRQVTNGDGMWVSQFVCGSLRDQPAKEDTASSAIDDVANFYGGSRTIRVNQAPRPLSSREETSSFCEKLKMLAERSRHFRILKTAYSSRRVPARPRPCPPRSPARPICHSGDDKVHRHGRFAKSKREICTDAIGTEPNGGENFQPAEASEVALFGEVLGKSWLRGAFYFKSDAQKRDKLLFTTTCQICVSKQDIK
jgi:hypothetical protein